MTDNGISQITQNTNFQRAKMKKLKHPIFKVLSLKLNSFSDLKQTCQY